MTFPVLDAQGNYVQVNPLPATGRKAAGDSLPIVLSTEDLAALNGISPKGSIFWNETSTALAANGAFLGADRDIGVAPGAAMASSYFNAFVTADQTGTIFIEAKDGSTYYTVATAPIAANTPLMLSVPVMNRIHRVRVVNGATAQTALRVNSSYSGA